MRSDRYSILLALGASVLASIAMMSVSLAAAPNQGGKTAFEASLVDTGGGLSAPVLTGDTALEDPGIDHCEGANSVPGNNRGFFTAFRRCLDDFILPGQDGTLGGADDIRIDRGDLSATQDKTNGDVVAIRLFFRDIDDNQYETDVVMLSSPSPVRTTGFTIQVREANVEVRPHGRGNKPVVGNVSIGDIVYTPKIP